MNNYIKPNWPAPKNIQAYTSKRMGGVSRSPYNSFNFSLLTGDNPDDVLANRKQLCQELKLLQEPCWLKQEHSDLVLSIDNHSRSGVVADASFTITVGLVSVVLTADCVPILVGDRKGRIVAAIHAGWKGIASRIIGNTIEANEY